ncbi:MAG: ABC transporter permease [Chloroflexi bacterium]|nr:ABC transporter permease [Chloroflexota bacterium]
MTEQTVIEPIGMDEGISFSARDVWERLVDQSLGSPLGFITGVVAGVFAASIGFLIATAIMPVWLWRRRKFMGVLGALILLASVLVALFAPVIQPTHVENFPNPPYVKGSLSAEDRFQSPSVDHVFGTDRKGQDVVTRIIYGSEVTVLVGLGTVILTAVLATVLGIFSGFFAGESLAWTVRAPNGLAAMSRQLRNPGSAGLAGRAVGLVGLLLVTVYSAGWLVLVSVMRLIDMTIRLVGEIAALPFNVVTTTQRLFGSRRVDAAGGVGEQIAGATDSPLGRRREELTAGMSPISVPLPNVDIALQRVIDVWIAFPAIFLILAIVAIFGSGGTGFFGLGRGPDFGPQASNSAEWLWEVFPNTTVVIVTLSVVLAAGNTRVIRGAVLGIKAEQYVEAARAIGSPSSRIMAAHILPNVVPTVIILASLNLGIAVLAEAAISFLGYGIAPPYPTWGRDLGGQTLTDAPQAWWIAVFPGVAITVSVFGFNMMGDALRDILDPRLRGT